MIGLDNPLHLLIVLGVLLLLFGAKRLPEMGRSLGSALRGFKESVSGESLRDPAGAATGAGAVAQVPAAAPSGAPAAHAAAAERPGEAAVSITASRS